MTPLSPLVTHPLGLIRFQHGRMTWSRESSVGSVDKLTPLSSGSTLRIRLVALGKLVEDAALAVEAWRVDIDSAAAAVRKLSVMMSEQEADNGTLRRSYGK